MIKKDKISLQLAIGLIICSLVVLSFQETSKAQRSRKVAQEIESLEQENQNQSRTIEERDKQLAAMKEVMINRYMSEDGMNREEAERTW